MENSQGQVTHYVGDAEVLAKADGRTEVRRYVSGMTQLQVIQPGISPYTQQEYLLTDALGSTHRIVDDQGELAFGNTSKQAFATFGERANADDRSTLSEFDQANFNSLLPRGYTGHQQADEVGVVHMNGRIYDPRLGRFLQADSVMEDIFDPQALNSYSYVRNNPMNATDPTGHWRAKEQGILRQVAAIVITIATGVNVQGILAKAAVAKTTAAAAALTTQAAAVAAVGGALSGGVASGTLKGALLGALGGFTFHQIGISSLGSTERVFAHALAGGTLEVLGGGKFGHGFVSAGLSKALSPLADTGDVFSDGLVNAAIGGTVSEITGGDFGNGAVMAATQYAFNQLSQFGDDQTLTYDNEASKFSVNGTSIDCPSAMGCWGLKPPSTAASRAEGAAFAGELILTALPAGRLLRLFGRAPASMVRLGKTGENIIASLYDIGPKGFFRNAAGMARFPDGINRGLRTLSEVKNVARQGWTAKDYSSYASSQGLSFNLYLEQGAAASSRLARAASQGSVNIIRVKMR